jgi:hypothetical protein
VKRQEKKNERQTRDKLKDFFSYDLFSRVNCEILGKEKMIE